MSPAMCASIPRATHTAGMGTCGRGRAVPSAPRHQGGDSLQLTARHKVATPVNWQQGQDVIIAGSVSNDEARQTFGEWKEPKPYIRIVPQPASRRSPARGCRGRVVVATWPRHSCSWTMFLDRQRSRAGASRSNALGRSAQGGVPGRSGRPCRTSRYHSMGLGRGDDGAGHARVGQRGSAPHGPCDTRPVRCLRGPNGVRRVLSRNRPAASRPAGRPPDARTPRSSGRAAARSPGTGSR